MARKYCGVTGCAVEATLAVVGGRWKPVLLFHLLEGRKRFSDLCRAVPNATAVVPVVWTVTGEE